MKIPFLFFTNILLNYFLLSHRMILIKFHFIDNKDVNDNAIFVNCINFTGMNKDDIILQRLNVVTIKTKAM